MKKYIRKMKYFIIFALCLVLTPNAVAQVAGTPYIPMMNVQQPATPDVSGNYSLVGKTCYDVYKTNWDISNTNTCMPLEARTNDFASTKTFDYIFTNSASFSNLSFSVRDDVNGVVESVALSGTNVGKVTFKSNINNMATGVTKYDYTFTFTLVATFIDNIGVTREITIPYISVQDCCCGCPVKKAGGGWITFQCYNLGAVDDIKPKIPKTPKQHFLLRNVVKYM